MSARVPGHKELGLKSHTQRFRRVRPPRLLLLQLVVRTVKIPWFHESVRARVRRRERRRKAKSTTKHSLECRGSGVPVAFGVHSADGGGWDLSLVCSWEVCSREGWTTVCSEQRQGNHPTMETDEAFQNKRKMRYWQSKPLFRVCSWASEF